MRPIDPRLLRRAAAVRRLLAATVGIGAATSVLIVTQAWVLARAIEAGVLAATSPRPATAGTVFAGLLPTLAAVVIGRAALAWLGSTVAQRSASAVKSQLRNEIAVARVTRADVGGSSDTAAVIMTATSGLDALDDYFARYLPQLVLAVIGPAVVVVAIWSVDWLSAVTVVATLPLVPVFMILVGRLTQDRARDRWRTHARLAHHFADLVAGLPTLQVLGRAGAQVSGVERSAQAHRRATVATLRIAFLSSLVLELVAMLSVALVAVGVGLRTVEGHLGLGVALFVLVLAPEAYRPLREVGTHYHAAADGLAAADHAFTIIDTATSPSPAVATRAPIDAGPGRVGDARGSVVLRGVAVRYDGSETDALAPTDLTWASGEVLALTGPSGSGKSTLLLALLGLVPLRTGTITADGDGVLDPATLRRRFAVVPQRPQLLTASVADNVRLGAPATPDQVEHALRAAGAVGLAADRVLRAGDESVSAGELRRLALARALLRVQTGLAQALVLDEPTAGLDADAELAVIRAVRDLGVGVLVVTHRPAVIAAADRVVELAGRATGERCAADLVRVGS